MIGGGMVKEKLLTHPSFLSSLCLSLILPVPRGHRTMASSIIKRLSHHQIHVINSSFGPLAPWIFIDVHSADPSCVCTNVAFQSQCSSTTSSISKSSSAKLVLS
jgi:hypothetical protein